VGGITEQQIQKNLRTIHFINPLTQATEIYRVDYVRLSKVKSSIPNKWDAFVSIFKL